MSVRQCCGRRVLRHAFLQSQSLTLQAVKLLHQRTQHPVWQPRLFISVCRCGLMQRGNQELSSIVLIILNRLPVFTDPGKLSQPTILIMQRRERSFLFIFFFLVSYIAPFRQVQLLTFNSIICRSSHYKNKLNSSKVIKRESIFLYSGLKVIIVFKLMVFLNLCPFYLYVTDHILDQ